MTFDVQAPSLLDLLIFPALAASAIGLILRRRLNFWLALSVAIAAPGVLLTILILVDEWDHMQADFGRLAWLPAGWMINTMLTLPGTLVGACLLLLFLRVQTGRWTGER